MGVLCHYSASRSCAESSPASERSAPAGCEDPGAPAEGESSAPKACASPDAAAGECSASTGGPGATADGALVALPGEPSTHATTRLDVNSP